MTKQLNIFTCCNGIYKDFVPLFIYSNLYHNKNCFVEIGVDNISYDKIKDSISIIEKYYAGNFKINQVNFNTYEIKNKKYVIIPNTVRFLTTPSVKTDYIYISDIDIITLEKNILDIHIKNMDRTKLPYSNIVRPSSNRLTGLHFTKYENYYPLPDFEDLCDKQLLNHDEVFLFELVKKRYPKFNLEESFRPVHGIHVSLNRGCGGTPGWGVKKWRNEWAEFRNSEIFLEIEPTFSDLIKNKISIIDKYYNENNSL